MNLEFTKVAIQNFKAFQGRHELDLTRHGVGLHYVKGRNEYEPRLASNGASKSSIWAALSWCLYGRTIDGLRNTDIEPWVGKRSSRVSVYLKRDGKSHKVTRTTHPNSLLIDGKTAGQDDVAKFLGIDYEIFGHTILYGQGQPLFFDLSPSRKMELFTTTLNLDRWVARSDKARDLAKDRQVSCDVIQGALTGLQSQLDEIVRSLTNVKAQSLAWEAEQSKRDKVEAKELADMKKRRETLQDQYDVAERDYDGACTEMRALSKEIAQLTEYLDAAKDVVNEEQTKIDAAALQMRRLKGELADLGDADTCPTCGQPITGTDLASHKKELKTDIAKLAKKVEAGVSSGPIKARDDLVAQLDTARKAHAQFTIKSERAKDTADSVGPRLGEVQAQLEVARTRKDEREEARNPYMEQLQDLRRRKQKTEGNIGIQRDKLKELERKIKRALFWVKGFKDVQLFIIEDILHELELTTNALLGDMGLIGWSIQYAVEKESKKGTIQRGLNVTIQSPRNKRPVKWEVWSGGEGQRLRVVGSLALSEVLLNHAGVTCNLEILDEPTQHLAMSGVRDLVETLAERANRLEKSSYFVDHRAIESSRFTSTVLVVKDREGARIEG